MRSLFIETYYRHAIVLILMATFTSCEGCFTSYDLTGTIKDPTGAAVSGATLFWEGHPDFVIDHTDQNGFFDLSMTTPTDFFIRRFVISKTGFKTKTLLLSDYLDPAKKCFLATGTLTEVLEFE